MSKQVAKLPRNVLVIGTLVLIYVGFRFVTQAGQGLGVIQNDGYGGTGGIFILVGGLVFGYLFSKSKK